MTLESFLSFLQELDAFSSTERKVILFWLFIIVAATLSIIILT